MKKVISLLLALVLCLSLPGCGKSEAVKNVEAMINELGEITVDSGNAIQAIDAAYAALTEEEQQKVKNYTGYLAARDNYYILVLPGEWKYNAVDIWHITQGSHEQDFTLYADMTWEGILCGPASGTWSVTNGKIVLKETNRDFEYGHYGVTYYEGTLGLQFYNDERAYPMYMRPEDHEKFISKYFLVVDLAEADPADYFEFCAYEKEERNEWGDLTGTGYTQMMLKSKLYDQGWLYVTTRGDFAIEVLIPEHSGSVTYSDGYVSTGDRNAESVTVTYSPFTSSIYRTEYYQDQYRETYDLTPDQLAFGRSKGQLVFVNEKYVTVTTDKNGDNNRILVWNNGDDVCQAEYYSDYLQEDLPY